jgi:hypothetical protein
VLQSLHRGRVVPSELLPPIGLEDQGPFNTVRPKPESDQQQESHADAPGSGMARGQKAHSSAGLAGGPLIPRQRMLSKMIPGGGSQGMLVQNVLDIRKGKRFLSFPGPGARVTAGAGPMRTLEASSSQDVADGVRREGKALRNQPSRPTGEGHNRSAFATLAPGPRSPQACGAVRCAGGGSDRSGRASPSAG